MRRRFFGMSFKVTGSDSIQTQLSSENWYCGKALQEQWVLGAFKQVAKNHTKASETHLCPVVIDHCVIALVGK